MRTTSVAIMRLYRQGLHLIRLLLPLSESVIFFYPLSHFEGKGTNKQSKIQILYLKCLVLWPYLVNFAATKIESK